MKDTASNARRENLKRLLRPRHIAFVGQHHLIIFGNEGPKFGRPKRKNLHHIRNMPKLFFANRHVFLEIVVQGIRVRDRQSADFSKLLGHFSKYSHIPLPIRWVMSSITSD